MTLPVLYQFPVSHYCEKARWALDHKRVRYRVNNLLPGAHGFVTRPLAAVWTVPVLRDGAIAIGDSTTIAQHVDNTRDGPSLYPRDEGIRARAVALEEWFDRHAGPPVRAFLYGELLAEPGAASRVFFDGYGLVARTLFSSGHGPSSGFERLLAKRYGCDAPARERHLQAVYAAFDELERLTEGDDTRPLVGGSLTIADITAASLLAPMLAPAGSPWFGSRAPTRIAALRDELRERPAGRWIVARYALDRGVAVA